VMFRLGEDQLSCSRLVGLASRPSPKIVISDLVRARLGSYRRHIDKALQTGQQIYGVNTGFGFLANVAIAPDQLQALQLNLIRSHACGVGELAPPEIVRALLILRAHTFCLGHSAVSPECVAKVLELISFDILPAVPMLGSVGASGDLAPLAHIAQGLIGEGKSAFRGKWVDTGAAFAEVGIQPYIPKPKEGLSLINGTHFMSAVSAHAVCEARRITRSADLALAMSLEAFKGTLRAFDERIQMVRHQDGQAIVARNIRTILSGPDQIKDSHRDCGKVQDPYSFRCGPQVHGAVRDTLQHVENVINRELNSVTDNPLVFENGDIVSGGNFHGAPVAAVMDFLAIAMTDLASISERRIEKLINPQMSGLPPFLSKDSGLNSGYMIPQVTAAALVSEAKVYGHPASTDSIPTSADKEDHVSMGPISARKARKVNRIAGQVVGIELLAGAQGIDLLSPLAPAPFIKEIHAEIRRISPFMDVDRSLAPDFASICEWIISGGVDLVCDRANLRIE
jgi:histidine ammonia-lyase